MSISASPPPPELSRRLAALFLELGQLDSLLGLEVPDAVRTYLVGRRASLGAELAELLGAWIARGGGVELAGPPAAPRSEPAPLPPEAPRPEPPRPEPPRVEVRPEPRPEPRVEARPEPRPEPRAEATRPPLRPGEWVPELEALLRGLRWPADEAAELARCRKAVKTSAFWLNYPPSVQRDLVGLLAARLRWLQDECGLSEESLGTSFSQLTAFSARERPGFVLGLTRAHTPRTGSWVEDADAYLEQLETALPPVKMDGRLAAAALERLGGLIAELDGAPPFAREAVRSQVLRELRASLEAGLVRADDPALVKLAAPLVEHLEGAVYRTLRRAIRAATEERVDEGALPEDWPWADHTLGRRATLLGGVPQEGLRVKMEAAFGFTPLDWEDMGARVQVRERVLSHRLDLVLLLEPDENLVAACRDARVPVAELGSASLGRVRRAVERLFEPGS